MQNVTLNYCHQIDPAIMLTGIYHNYHTFVSQHSKVEPRIKPLLYDIVMSQRVLRCQITAEKDIERQSISRETLTLLRSNQTGKIFLLYDTLLILRYTDILFE